MKLIVKNIHLLFLCLCFPVGAFIGHYFMPFAHGQKQVEQVELKIRNTFPISVLMEVKCDIVPGTYNQYKFYKRITIPKNSFFVLKVPNNLKFCECWTIDYKLFK